MARTLVIGDIHGGLKALQQLVKRAGIVAEDRLIFLGDYVDGWSQSPQVLEFLLQLAQKNNCVFIRGNHDQLLLEWLQDEGQNIDEGMWFKHGGRATVDAYRSISQTDRLTHIDFLQNLRDYYLDNHQRLFVHAGFTNLNGVEFEYFPKMFYWERTLWETALALDPLLSKSSDQYPKRLKLYREIFIGHTPVTRIGETKPVNRANVWNLDTGAAFRGSLTIMDADTKEFWQSDPLPLLYPGENGRN